ncbi:MAG: PKD domain-containing protein [bacterium]|nr:PKD domain-containing protein [bacterium]
MGPGRRLRPFLLLVMLVVTVLPWLGCNNDSPTEPQLIANFTFTGQGLIVEFTDRSEGMVLSWLWDFGDQGRSSIQNPTHEYQRADTYIVRLTVCSTLEMDNPEDCSTRERAVTVPL